MKRRCAILYLLPLLAAAAFGQMLTSSSFSMGPNKSFQGAATFQTPVLVPRPIVGAPYYGEHISEDVQTLANGAHITRSSQYQGPGATRGAAHARSARWQGPLRRMCRCSFRLPILWQGTSMH